MLRFLLCLSMAAAQQPYPAEWGLPPVAQTRDLVPLPGGYGMGSSTLARWIGQKLKEGGGAQLGETCEGFNEMTGKQFPACARGLVCQSSGGISIPGAGKKCIKPPRTMPGGLRSLDPADARLAEVVAEVYQTNALERATQASGRNGMLTSRPTVVEAASQVVAGTNYFVKLRLASGEYAHARIYDHFGSVTLTAVQVAKSEADPLKYF